MLSVSFLCNGNLALLLLSVWIYETGAFPSVIYVCPMYMFVCSMYKCDPYIFV